MLTIAGATKAFGPRVLFEEVSLQINASDRLGLVGPNGAGKSTLLAMMLGKCEPDSGTVVFERGVRVGHLPQESVPAGTGTVLDLAAGKNDLVEGHSEGEVDLGFEARVKRILSGLAFRETDFDRPLREMSGGWVMRAYLARLLAQAPDLLLLDEPTNHLDLESLIWLQDYLRNYRGAILMISHDREFLNQLTTGIVAIKHRRLHRYRGNYDEYLVQSAARDAQHLAAYKNQQKKIEALQNFVDRFGAKATKASQAQNKLKQIERMEKIEAPLREDRKIRFRFPQPPRSGLKVVTLKDVHQAYGQHEVYRGLDFVAERGQRIVLVGPNGAGKSTLLKILAGVTPFQRGIRDVGLNTRLGYYSQYRIDTLTLANSVLAEASGAAPNVPEQTVRSILGAFLFCGDDVFKPVSVLSGGEKSRLALVKFLLDPPNLLLMDEPTTHLDMSSIDALIGALKQFEGTLIFISHDVYFIRAMATSVLHIAGGRLTPYAGDYQYYLDKSRAVSARAALTSGGGAVAVQDAPEEVRISAKERRRMEAEARQAKARERKAHEEKVAATEAEILRLEERQKELTAQLEDPATYASGNVVTLNREFLEIAGLLERLNGEWAELAEKVPS
ncbi:MAG: ATP-binding cassette domain-containing protein [Verrucomicrobiae bacterium]|nr:ATP-binding cassette domain-containing protein [Verrucomicrobiae bacterium]